MCNRNQLYIFATYNQIRMKEIQPIDKDKVAIVKQQEQRTELKYLGSLRPKNGHTLFKVSRATGEISEASFEEIDVVYNQVNSKKDVENLRTKKKVIVEEGYFYVSALNKKNVLRKITTIKFIENGKTITNYRPK